MGLPLSAGGPRRRATFVAWAPPGCPGPPPCRQLGPEPHRSFGSLEVGCHDKTGTLTESEIKLAAHVDQAGEDSREVLRLAALNSAFQSGIKSPLDAAILSHQKLDAGAWQKLDEIPFDFERRRVSV